MSCNTPNMEDDGYILLDLGLGQSDIDLINSQVDEYAKSQNVKKQADGYHYSAGARLFEAWRECPAVAALACNLKIMSAVENYGIAQKPSSFQHKLPNPIPFQTINFLVGSNQPLHSDTIHFQSIPNNLVVGVWVALENMDENNGALCVVPGSHRWPTYTLQDIGWPLQKFGEQFTAYADYEQFLIRQCKSKGAEPKEIYVKAGTAIIWAANLLHGGSPIRDPNRTRKSQAIHYYFEGCKYYSPMFSDVPNGIYSWKDLSGKDILGKHVENLSKLRNRVCE